MFNDNAAPSDWTFWNILAVAMVIVALLIGIFALAKAICGG